jgi:hypothetical protein
MKGSAVIEKPPKREPAKPSVHLAPQPRATAPVMSPAVAPPAPKTSVDVMAMHSAYGNAAVARAATTGEMGIAKPKDTPPPPPSAAAHAPAAVPATTAAAPEAKSAAPAATAPAPAAGGGAPDSKSPAATAATAKAPTKSAAPKSGRDSGAPKGEKDAARAGAAGESGGKGGGKASPHADPAFASVIHKVKMVATHQKTHAPAASKAAAAHSAAVSPSNEVSSRAAAKQTDAMDQQKPKPFNRDAFKKALLDKIKATAPKTLKEADDFKDNNNLGSVKKDLNSEVAQEKTESQGPLAETVAAQPDQTGIDATPNTPLPPADTGAAQNVAATGAAPKPASAADIDLQAGPQQLNQEMADSNVTEEQLKDSNEPTFQGALGEKKAVEKESAAAPKAFRAEEKGLLHTAQVEAQTVATKHTLDMHGSRKHAMSAAAAHQAEAKAEEEKQRTTIYAAIDKIYQTTKTNVEARLKKLDKDVNDAFDAGATDAQASFENLVGARMSAYKDDRYGGWTGGLKWLKDKFFDLPDEVNAFYVEGHDLYVSKMDAVIDRVAGLVETGLNEAKGLIAAGKAEIQTYLGTLGPQWQATGKKAAGEIQGKFDALEQSVTDKQDQLVDALATKYNDNMKKVNDRIEAMKEENKGLVSKAVGAIKGVIQAIIDLKNMLFDVLSRAAAAIGMIIAHPIKFLSNLVDAGKLGFSNFADHIVEHLKQGFMEWLFGAVAETGITLPKNFDLPGILSLVMQILGLTYANIRSRAVKILGEKVVKSLETAAEIFKILITKGPAGLWEYIKDKVGDLKAMVIEKIMAFVMEKVVMAGITWLIGLLNPAGAFIKACKAIYDIVMFFVEHGKQILALVNAIIDSITAIAKGAIGSAAAFVENSLAKSIPVMIGFLAGLLGVSGISDKIKEVIDAIRKPINDAIDWVINKAVDLVKAVGGLLGFGKKDEKNDAAKPASGEDVGVDQELDMHGEGHHIYAVVRGENIDVEMASERRELLETLVSSALYQEEHGQKRETLLKHLEWALKALKTLKWDWAAAHNKSDAEKRESIKRDLGAIASFLVQIGNEFGIPSLKNMGHASKYAEGGSLKEEFRAEIRTRFYPTRYNTDVQQWKAGELVRLENGPDPKRPNPDQASASGKRKYFWCVEAQDYVVKEEATIDHKPWVVQHWNKSGHDMVQDQRIEYYNDYQSGYRVISRSKNSSDGNEAKMVTGGYSFKVGPNFRGPNDIE